MTPCRTRNPRFAVAQDAGRGDPRLQRTGIRRMSVQSARARPTRRSTTDNPHNWPDPLARVASQLTDRDRMTAMRIVYFSDVHIEIRESQPAAPWSDTLPLGFGPELSTFVGAADLLILAGDIGRVHSTRNVSPLSYAREAADFLGCGVVLVPGNHEYYRGCFREDRAALLAAGDRTVTVLDRGEASIARGGAPLRILGATLWTDYAAAGDPAVAMAAAEREIYDHRLIRGSEGSGFFSPVDALAEHRLSRTWLLRKLTEPADGPTLVDQLGVHTDMAAQAADAAFQHIAHTQLAADLLGIDPLGLRLMP